MTRRILFVVDRPCLPARDGSGQRYTAWLEYLGLQNQKTYFLSFNGRKDHWDRPSIEILRRYSQDHLLLNDYEPGPAWFFRTVANLVSRATTGKRYRNERVEQWYGRENRKRIQDFLELHSIDTILVNKVHSAALLGTGILEEFTGRRIIDIHDIHANHFLAAQEVLHRLPLSDVFHSPYRKFLLEKLMYPFYDYQAALQEELGIYRLFDTILATSLYEYEWLRKRIPDASSVKYLSPLILPQITTGKGEPARGRFDAGLIASSGLLNIEGISHFGSKILPEILRHRSEFRLLIAGGICEAAREILGEKPGITYTGKIDNLIDFYQDIRTVLVPLLSGTGVSVKTLEGMAYGKPVVSTTAGVRGLEVRPGTDVVVEDDPVRYAKNLLVLLDSPKLRGIMSREALNTIREKYSLERHRGTLDAIFVERTGKKENR